MSSLIMFLTDITKDRTFFCEIRALPAQNGDCLAKKLMEYWQNSRKSSKLKEKLKVSAKPET